MECEQITELNQISDLQTLISIKEQIKDQIIQKLTWQERINLYRKIKSINERIEELQSAP